MTRMLSIDTKLGDKPDRVSAFGKERLTSVNAKEFVVDNSSQRKVIEHIGEVFPHIHVTIFAHAIRVKSINFREEARFMVAPE